MQPINELLFYACQQALKRLREIGVETGGALESPATVTLLEEAIALYCTSEVKEHPK